MFHPHLDGHRLRLELVDHSMSHSGDFRQLGIAVARLDADYRTMGMLRYPERFGTELVAGDLTAIVDRWLWSDMSDLVRYVARQQRQIDKYSAMRLLQ